MCYTINHIALNRRSPVKLRRFCHYLQISDIKKNFNNEENLADASTLEPNEIHVESKQLRSALLYLWHIDPSGFLPSIADPTKNCPLNDESLKERQQRMEIMTKSMDVHQYFEYSKVSEKVIFVFDTVKFEWIFQAKQNSFKRNLPSPKFKEWFLKERPTPELTMTARTWEILGYVTYETVAQIVDLSFLVRRDNNASKACDALERNAAPVRTSRAGMDASEVVDLHCWMKRSLSLMKLSYLFSNRGRKQSNHYKLTKYSRHSGDSTPTIQGVRLLIGGELQPDPSCLLYRSNIFERFQV